MSFGPPYMSFTYINRKFHLLSEPALATAYLDSSYLPHFTHFCAPVRAPLKLKLTSPFRPMYSLPPAATVLVVAPPTLQRQGLLATLRDARPDLPVTATADVGGLLERLRRAGPTLLILDAALPGVSSDTLIAQARAANPAVRILVLGGKKLPFAIARLIVEHGAGLLLNRRATPGELVAAVARLIGAPAPDQPVADVEVPPGVEDPRGAYVPGSEGAAEFIPLFSPRELEVLQLVAADCPSQEIAARLFISIRTVEAHRRTLLEKAGTRSMIGLVLQAVRSGWLAVA